MGRETITYVDLGHEAGEVKLVLESHGLTLRGPIRRFYPRDTLKDVRIDGETLHLTANGEPLALHLGAKASATWSKALTTPPPSLASKLGLSENTKTLFFGKDDDEALRSAITGNLAPSSTEAQLLIARIDTIEDLTAALTLQSQKPALPLWIVYPKGTKATFGDTQIRTHMRNLGFIDTKTSAVSEKLTATKYGVKLGK